MPTVILLDVSLSMSRPAGGESLSSSDDIVEVTLRKHLAAQGCCQLLDYFSQFFKLEFTSLSIKRAINTVDEYDKTDLEAGLSGAAHHVLDEWGNHIPCQIVLVTDGNLGTSQQSLSKALISSPRASNFPLPFPFPARLHIVCIANKDEPCFQASRPIYQRLIELNGDGNIYVPSGLLNNKSVSEMFDEIIQNNFSSYSGMLHCGKLNSPITLSPPPEPYYKQLDFEVVRLAISTNLRICGFLNISDVSSPPTYSRHLVLPLSQKGDLVMVPKTEGNSDDESINDEGKVPSFCVLLHGGLKRENMVALCQVAENWFGILYSWADSKKKSNLMLSLLAPGLEIVPWLGSLANLGPVSCLTGKDLEKTSPFPVKATERKSYALNNCAVWVRPGGLQSDIQKILRHARKLPEKQELNRVRRAAIMYGFIDLLEGLAALLEKESLQLPSNAHPDASIQLQHASDMLRNTDKKDLRFNIQAHKVTFSKE